MNSLRFQPTLKLTRPFGKTVILTVFILVGLVSLLEIATRLSFIQSKLPPPSIGSPNTSLEANLHVLDELGSFDCIFIGSSFVLQGINPAFFEKSYQKTTGETIRCYTFGVRGLTASGVEVLAPLLIERYHPRWLIYAIHPRDLATAVDESGYSQKDLDQVPWVHQQQGDFSLAGWLSEYSHFYRYYLTFRNWDEQTFVYDLEDRQNLETIFRSTRGYQVIFLTQALPLPPDTQTKLRKYYAAYAINPPELQSLRRLLQAPSETKMIMVEFPLLSQIFEDNLFLPEDYDTYAQTIQDSADLAQTLYIRVNEQLTIPDNGWKDASHLNTVGATAYSDWLGEQIGRIVNMGHLK
ncbi:MAG TPA: hypothetical protein VHP83_01630 [Aggregatilineaceae bacterium]|nr:hypothetical protein [Aggregatilineaceae bacterium]